MKRVFSVMFGVVLMASVASAQQPPGPTGLAAGLRTSYNNIKTNLTEAAEKMADAEYAFKPSPEIRSYGGQLGTSRTSTTCSALRSRAR